MRQNPFGRTGPDRRPGLRTPLTPHRRRGAAGSSGGSSRPLGPGHGGRCPQKSPRAGFKQNNKKRCFSLQILRTWTTAQLVRAAETNFKKVRYLCLSMVHKNWMLLRWAICLFSKIESLRQNADQSCEQIFFYIRVVVIQSTKDIFLLLNYSLFHWFGLEAGRFAWFFGKMPMFVQY